MTEQEVADLAHFNGKRIPSDLVHSRRGIPRRSFCRIWNTSSQVYSVAYRILYGIGVNVRSMQARMIHT